MELGFCLIGNNNVLAKYLYIVLRAQLCFRASCLSLSISVEMQRWEAESGMLFAHSWLCIVTRFHLTGVDRGRRPKAGVWLSVMGNDRYVGSWVGFQMWQPHAWLVIKSQKFSSSLQPAASHAAVITALVEGPHHWPAALTLPSHSALCNLFDKALLNSWGAPNIPWL